MSRTNLSGTPKDLPPAPDLLIVDAYDPGAFRTLMRTGKAPGGHEVGEMSQIARGNLASFTDDEISAIYDYLAARAKIVTAIQDSSGRR